MKRNTKTEGEERKVRKKKVCKYYRRTDGRFMETFLRTSFPRISPAPPPPEKKCYPLGHNSKKKMPPEISAPHFLK